MQRLLGFALDGDVADPVALAAIRDALDRAGLKSGTEVEVKVRAFEAIFDTRIEGGSRADFRRSIGIEEPPTHALAASTKATDSDSVQNDVDVIDAEVTSDDIDERIFRASLNPPVVDFDGDLDGYGQPVIPDHCERGSAFHLEPTNPFEAASQQPPRDGLMNLEDAVAAQAQMRKHAVLRPIQRALPRGRS